MPDSSPEPTVVFLSLGQLYVARPGDEPVSFESPFAVQAEERMERSRQANAWKGNVWNNNRMQSDPRFGQPVEARRSVRFSSVTNAGQADEMLYMLDMGDVSGVFRYDLARSYETRLVHRNAFPARDLATSDEGEFAVAVGQPDGSIGLAVSKTEGRHWNQIAAGDALNLSPAWVPGERSLVFQSAQIGRNESGAFVGISPFAIEKLELKPDAESVQVAVADGFDLMSPRYDSQGRLLFIRRPYEPMGHFSLWDQLRDVLLLPYRLLMTLFAIFEFFSVMLRNQPLDTVGAGKRRNTLQQSHLVTLHGRVIDTRKEMAKGSDGNLVPGAWELVRQEGDGETVLASHVTCFDICHDDSVIYSNGSRVFQLTQDGQTKQLCKGQMISNVAAIGMPEAISQE